MQLDDRVLILGGKGLVGSAFQRELARKGFTQVTACTRADLDLTDQVATREYFSKYKPDYVLMAAGKVGGIFANSSFPWDFSYDNILMAANVLDACRRQDVKKVLMLGSTCIYPRLAEQPIKESSLLAGPLEPSNEWYAVAKIAGIKLGQALRRQHGLSVIAAMPTNLYGPNDNFHPQYSHVLPALVQRFHLAKLAGQESVEVWGTGKPRREFLYVDDLAEALLLLMNDYDEEEIINIGTGEDLEIGELVTTISQVVGYQGKLVYDTSKPDGTPRKQTDSSKLFSLGWRPKTSLLEGIRKTYEWYCAHCGKEAARV